MSTKSTITHGDDFHLYHDMELGRTNDVYLQINGTYFEAAPGEVTVLIPIEVWEHLRKFPGFTPRYHLMTDEELRAICEREVDSRIQEWKAAPEGGKGLLRLFGSIAYGDIENPRDQQIEMGLEFLIKERSQEREIVEKIKALELQRSTR